VTRFPSSRDAVSAGGHADRSLTLNANPALAIAAELVARGSTWVRGCGNSMAPTVRDGDRVLVRAIPFHSLRRGDVVVIAASHTAILHRIQRILPKGFVETVGDAKLADDGLISRENVLAVAVLAERARSRITLRPTFEFGFVPFVRGTALLARAWLVRSWRWGRVLFAGGGSRP
jgi:hypothetical protein